MSSEVDICNRALGFIGHKQQIASFDDPSVAAQMASLYYESSRDTVLGRFPWRFATRRALLAEIPQPCPPGGNWQHKYMLPADCLYPQRLVPNYFDDLDVTTCDYGEAPYFGYRFPYPFENLATAFEVEANDAGSGRVLLCNIGCAQLIYTSQIVNPLAFTPLFQSCLVWFLAAQLALVIPGKAALEQQLRQRFEVEIAEAGSAELRGTNKLRMPVAESIRARNA